MAGLAIHQTAQRQNQSVSDIASIDDHELSHTRNASDEDLYGGQAFYSIGDRSKHEFKTYLLNEK